MNITSLQTVIKDLGNDSWKPVDLVNINGQVLRIAYFKGDYHWHSHEQEELLFVYEGEIFIKFKEREILVLKKGEMILIPRGVEHCTGSKKGGYVLMLDLEEVDLKGD